MRILALDSSAVSASACVTEDGKVHGVKCFYILEDGSIEEDSYEE